MDAVGMSPAQNDPAPIREETALHLIQYIEPFCSVMSAAGTLCMSCHRYAKRIGESLSSISNLLVHNNRQRMNVAPWHGTGHLVLGIEQDNRLVAAVWSQPPQSLRLLDRHVKKAVA